MDAEGFSGAEDMFSFFGGGGGGGGSSIFNLLGGGGGRAQRRRKGEDTVQPLTVTLEDLYKGKTSKLKLTKKVICVDCNGRGGKEGAVQTCSRCRGNGRVMLTRQVGPGMIQQMQSRCDTCSGEGHIIDEKHKCRKCQGRRTIQEQKILEVNIPPGMRDGQKIVFHAEGDQEPGIEAGDVILIIKMRPHEVFQRRGDDLVMKQKVTLNEALCGYSTVVQHLDGRTLLLKNPPNKVIKPDSIRQVKGEGMPIKGTMERGKLYIVFEVAFPENHFLTENGFKQLEKLLPARPTESLPTSGEHLEEVSLSEYDERRHDKARQGRREAYQDDGDSDDEMHGGGGGGPQHVQCATQ